MCVFVIATHLHPSVIFPDQALAYPSGAGLAIKYFTSLEVTASDKHSSVLRNGTNYGR
jgi:hypothetical protein